MGRWGRVVGTAGAGLTGLLLTSCAAVVPSAVPVDAPADYQLGGDYEPVGDVRLVVRDWYAGQPLRRPGAWSVCYVNAFQTQPDEPGTERPDERSAWPDALVLDELGDDPGWPGELLVDLSTPASRRAAAEHVAPALDTCADKGFDAVELDNLDSWTRFDGAPAGADVPFGREEALAYAALLVEHAHGLGLAVAQKNAVDLTPEEVDRVGFDLAVVEECGAYDECGEWVRLHDDRLLVVEYTDAGFAAACAAVGEQVAVVRRDLDLLPSGAPGHEYDAC